MALLHKNAFQRVDKNRNTIHKPVPAVYTIFSEDNETYFQVDTYGSVDRITPEKVSQSLQINKEMAIVLVDLLRKEFNLN